ncbi:response regulator [Parvibaculum sp.]|jgi:CheY-like chemotaxis protein|uniref:response regulator n=1 Tax=Parvibaculum sp. TaxID=2024848 RepID=UPI002FD94507
MTEARILYVDDEPDIRDIAMMALELDPEIEARSCSSGMEALAEAAMWKPDLILLDVMMPEMDGPETLRRLRENEKTNGIPVVFITARTQVAEVQRFLGLGARGVIAKPFDPMELAGEARKYLGTDAEQMSGKRAGGATAG